MDIHPLAPLASPLANAFERQCEKEQQDRESKSNDILFNVLDKARFRDALARLIVRGNLSHRFVELEEWKAVCLALNPQCEKVLLRSRRSIPRRIGVIFERQRLAVKRSLQNALSRVHLSTDSWTSGVSHQGEFQAINASFVDESGCLQQVLLALPELHHGHAGELVAPLICRTLEVYGIEKRLGYVTADNASSNDTLCRAIERYMFTKHAINWSAQQHRLRCLGHILNIAVQAFLFCANPEALDIASQRVVNSGVSIEDAVATDGGLASHGALLKIYKLTVALRNLALHKDFKALAGKVLKLPGETRWNAWFTLLADAAECRDSVARIIDRHVALEPYRLTREDWECIEDCIRFLQPFHQATLLAEGMVTLDKFQVQVDFLIKHFQASEARFSTKASLLAAVNTSWLAFNKYYELTDEVPVHAAAILLHPGYRKEYTKKMWKQKWITDGVRRVHCLFNDLYSGNTDDESVSLVGTIDLEPTAFELHHRQLLDSLISNRHDEFTTFINLPPIKIAGSPIAWWSHADQRAAYPKLWKMAIDCLSAFPMSAASEAIFSGCRRTVTWTRSQLGGDLVEQTECLKDWQRRGYASTLEDDIDLGASENEDENLTDGLSVETHDEKSSTILPTPIRS